jgi:glycosyltransferase involved in cell wall biosynthesis
MSASLVPVRHDAINRQPAVLRVLVVDHTAELSGGEVALSRLLHAVDRQQYAVSVLLLADGPLEERLREDDVQVAVLRTSNRLTGVGRAEAVATPLALAASSARSLALVPRLRRAIRGAHPDLVVANTLKSAVLVSMAAPLSGRRWVWHLHDRIAPDYLPRMTVHALRALARHAPRAIVANSRATRQTLPGVPDSRITVVYPGVATHAAVECRAPSQHPSFALLGRVAPTKGQIEFVRAAAVLAPKLPGAVFSVVGDAMFNDAAFADEVRSLAATLGVADRVVFTGWLSNPGAAIANLTALVHASPVPEPFGQVLVEAMLVGVPVIGTNAGGVPEILDPEHQAETIAEGVKRTPLGLLVEPGDPLALAAAMGWMAEHAGDAAEMAVRARASAVARFEIGQTARRIEETWSRAAGSGRAREV